MPRTIRRSPGKAQKTWEKAHDSAVKTYGEGGSAHRVAYSALKHSFEKVGDHWEPKARRGPSDPRAAKPTPKAIKGEGETFRGVDYLGHSRDELQARARDLGVPGTSHMNKRELARAIARKQK
jgi:cation transport regulator ChaB